MKTIEELQARHKELTRKIEFAQLRLDENLKLLETYGITDDTDMDTWVQNRELEIEQLELLYNSGLNLLDQRLDNIEKQLQR